jgi:hypothetical protein
MMSFHHIFPLNFLTRKVHDMLALMLNLRFKSLRLNSSFIGHEYCWRVWNPCFLCSWNFIIICIHYLKLKILLLTTLINITIWIYLKWLQPPMNLWKACQLGTTSISKVSNWCKGHQVPFEVMKETWIHLLSFVNFLAREILGDCRFLNWNWMNLFFSFCL